MLYSKLNASNVSLNIVLRDLIAILKAKTDLENKLKQRCTLNRELRANQRVYSMTKMVSVTQYVHVKCLIFMN